MVYFFFLLSYIILQEVLVSSSFCFLENIKVSQKSIFLRFITIENKNSFWFKPLTLFYFIKLFCSISTGHETLPEGVYYHCGNRLELFSGSINSKIRRWGSRTPIFKMKFFVIFLCNCNFHKCYRNKQNNKLGIFFDQFGRRNKEVSENQ